MQNSNQAFPTQHLRPDGSYQVPTSGMQICSQPTFIPPKNNNLYWLPSSEVPPMTNHYAEMRGPPAQFDGHYRSIIPLAPINSASYSASLPAPNFLPSAQSLVGGVQMPTDYQGASRLHPHVASALLRSTMMPETTWRTDFLHLHL